MTNSWFLDVLRFSHWWSSEVREFETFWESGLHGLFTGFICTAGCRVHLRDSFSRNSAEFDSISGICSGSRAAPVEDGYENRFKTYGITSLCCSLSMKPLRNEIAKHLKANFRFCVILDSAWFHFKAWFFQVKTLRGLGFHTGFGPALLRFTNVQARCNVFRVPKFQGFEPLRYHSLRKAFDD